MDAREVVERLVGVDAALADRAGLAAALGDVARLRAWLEGREATLVTALAQVASFPEQVVAESERIAVSDADRVVRRAAVVESVPAFGDALRDGRVSGAHVDALGRALERIEPRERVRLLADADRLARAAEGATPEVFARTLRSAVAKLRSDDGMTRLAQQRRAAGLRTWVNPRTGMWCLAGEFDPLTGASLARRLADTVDTLFHDKVPETAPSHPRARQDHLRALAVVELILGKAGGSGRPDIVAVIHADQEAPDGGPTVDWGIPVEIPSRVLAGLAGTADTNAVVVRNGVVLHAPGCLDLGRTTRVANRAQRRALRAWHAACAVPGCAVHFDRCKIHHVHWWRHGGRTDLANLLPLCKRHHTRVHEGGWSLELTADRALTVRLPDGQVLTTGPPHSQAA